MTSGKKTGMKSDMKSAMTSDTTSEMTSNMASEMTSKFPRFSSTEVIKLALHKGVKTCIFKMKFCFDVLNLLHITKLDFIMTYLHAGLKTW